MTSSPKPAMPANRNNRAARLLERYREIERVAQSMLEAGRDGDWPRVRELEGTVRVFADGLAKAAQGNVFAPADERERMRILRRIVLVDADLRRIAQPSNRWLDSMLESRARVADARHGPA